MVTPAIRPKAGARSPRGGVTKHVRRVDGPASGITLDDHDGELIPTLKPREDIIRQIRLWNADLVLAPRPNDYHPDHRYTGVLVQDAAYMVSSRTSLPTRRRFARTRSSYFQDNFQRPNAFRPDVAVAIDDVIDKKIDMLDAHVSQFYEWLPWVDGTLEKVPKGAADRKRWLKETRGGQSAGGSRDADEMVRRGTRQGRSLCRSVRDLWSGRGQT